ncbi:unnamed protein product [Symbiodinium natans]|uniref:beta-glucosidase n=1 Tax=Symbiodinium natans TaxID=878477 RepID=A0A812IEU9_9DINO|nr:unnamed protein product [Symbiodinium natans]
MSVRLKSRDAADAAAAAEATVEVKNIGDFPSAEVVQVYALASNVPRALRAFRRTGILAPGESSKVSMPLCERALGAFYDESLGRWQPPAQGSEVQLEVGASSKDIRLRAKVVL